MLGNKLYKTKTTPVSIYESKSKLFTKKNTIKYKQKKWEVKGSSKQDIVKNLVICNKPEFVSKRKKIHRKLEIIFKYGRKQHWNIRENLYKIKNGNNLNPEV